MNLKLRMMTSLAACGAAAVLGGCYVVPLDPRYAPPSNLPPLTSPPGPAVALPPQQPMPVALQGRLYPVNDVAGRMGALTANANDNLEGRASFTINYAV